MSHFDRAIGAHFEQNVFYLVGGKIDSPLNACALFSTDIAHVASLVIQWGDFFLVTVFTLLREWG